MHKTFSVKSSAVNECLKYRELASIDSILLKKLNKFIIYGTEVFLITHSDDVYAFGSNSGRIGFRHLEEVKGPTIIPELCGKKVIDIKCGYSHSVALTQTGQIYTFGYSSDGRTGNGFNRTIHKPIEISVDNQLITAIDCMIDSTYVLTQSGQLYWFGMFYWSNNNKAYKPTKVVFPSEVKIKSISCGYYYILALTVDGKVFSCGRNIEGQLGLGNRNCTTIPQMIKLYENIKQIYCGCAHSLLLTSNGKVYSMGNNSWGQLGIGNKENQNIPKLVSTDQKEICCYEHISMSLDVNNRLFVWGNILCNKEVILTPFVTAFTSFQNVVNTYAEHRSTLEPIELFEPINSVIKTTTKMFDNPENSDLKFRVKSIESSEYKEIYCHKCFIKETNVYFQTMFANQWKENKSNEIYIEEYSYKSYYKYLKSLYTAFIDSEDMEELLEILSITEHYLDSDRKDKCVELIKEKTNIENVCSVYSSSIKFNSVNLKTYAFEIMSENWTDLIQTQDYKNMDPIYANEFLIELH